MGLNIDRCIISKSGTVAPHALDMTPSGKLGKGRGVMGIMHDATDPASMTISTR